MTETPLLIAPADNSTQDLTGNINFEHEYVPPSEASQVILMGAGDSVPSTAAGWDDAPIPETSANYPNGGQDLKPTYDLMQVIATHKNATSDPFYVLNNGDEGYNIADEGVFAERVQPMHQDIKSVLLPSPGNHEFNIGGSAHWYSGYRPWVYGDGLDGTNQMTYTRYNGATITARTNSFGPAITHHALRQTEGVHNWDGLNFTIDWDSVGNGLHGYWYDIDFGADVGWVFISLASNNADGCQPGDAQYHWLKETLENPAYASRKFFVQWHYDSFQDSEWSATAGNGAHFFQLCQNNAVDIVHNGHVHTYERYHRVQHGGGTNPLGPYVFICGTMGNDREIALGSNAQRAITLEGFIVGKWFLRPTGFYYEAYNDAGTLVDSLGSSGSLITCLR